MGLVTYRRTLSVDVLAAFHLSRDYSVYTLIPSPQPSTKPGQVHGAFQAFIGDFRPKLFQFRRCCLALCVCLSASSGVQGMVSLLLTACSLTGVNASTEVTIPDMADAGLVKLGKGIFWTSRTGPDR
jgi:hypothetical protein